MGEAGAGARAEAVVDLAAVRHNVEVLLAATAPGAALMIVVKADGYGHGALPVARAALAAGASWLGVCTLEEALELRAGGVEAPVLSWLHLPTDDFAPAIGAGVDLGVSSRAHLAGVLAGAREAGRPARLHLKIDTGLTRNGAQPADWDRSAGRRGAGGRGRNGRGRRRLVAPGPGRHAAAPDARPPGRPAHRGLAGGPGPRAAPDPAPGQLRGHPDPAGPALRPGPPGYRRATGWTRWDARPRTVRSARR